jgi:paraquat-inducible protein A
LDATQLPAAQPLIACHECDLLQREPAAAHHCDVKCSRCGAALFRNVPNGIDRTVALSLAGLILFIIANIFPFLSFEIGSQFTQTTLFTGVREFYSQGIWMLALLVFITSILAPLLQLLLMLYVFVPLKFGRLARQTRPAFRLLQHIRDWNMIEVFMIGILVALVKLTKMATIAPGIAMWSFVALIFLVTGAQASIDGRVVWRRLERAQ